jgi:cell division protein FtsB
MQEEYWAAKNEVIWENQVTILTKENATLTNENATLTNEVTTLSDEVTTLSDENAELRRILQQAGIDIPSV